MSNSRVSKAKSDSHYMKLKLEACQEEKRKVEEELALMETQYRLNAQRKSDEASKKIKKGKEAKYSFYEKELASVKTKAESSAKECDRKFEKFEKQLEVAQSNHVEQKKHLESEMESKLEKLRQQMKFIEEDYARRIEKLSSSFESLKTELADKMSDIERKKEGITSQLDSRIQTYYEPIFKDMLEDTVEEEIKLPPTYDKLKAKLIMLDTQIETTRKNYQAILEVEAGVHETAEEKELKKRREQLRREAEEQLKESERLRYEAEVQEALRRKEEYAKDEVRVKEKQVNIPLPSPEEKRREEARLKRMVEEQRKAEEYKKMQEADPTARSAVSTEDASDVEQEEEESPIQKKIKQYNIPLADVPVQHPPVIWRTTDKKPVKKAQGVVERNLQF